MPKLLHSTSVVGSEYNQILSRFSELIKFIHKNSDRYLGTNQQHYQKVVSGGGASLSDSHSDKEMIIESRNENDAVSSTIL